MRIIRQDSKLIQTPGRQGIPKTLYILHLFPSRQQSHSPTQTIWSSHILLFDMTYVHPPSQRVVNEGSNVSSIISGVWDFSMR